MTGKRMAMQEYLEADGISASGLNLVHRSPAHYMADKLGVKKDTDALIFGGMFHTLALEPELFDVEYGVLPEGIDKRTTIGKQAFANWQIENNGKSAIKKEDFDKAQGMAASLRAHTRANSALNGGHAERSVFFHLECSAHGPTLCKSRFDYVTPNGLIVDLKTTTDARPDAFSRDCWKYGYHRKAAFYMSAYKAEFKEKAKGFLFVAIEKDAPYAVSVFLADEGMIDQGEREYMIDLNTYAECIQSNIWPSYPDEVMAIQLPRWAQDDGMMSG